MNGPLSKSTVPRYSDKYKDVLERAMKRTQSQKEPTEEMFFYRVRSIGVGAFSFVHMVKEQRSGTVYAQKSMLKKNISKEVLTEIKIHFYLRHPNIVQLYHVYQDADYLYLLMEFAQESLFALLKNHKLEGKVGKEHWVVGILEQIIRAVQYMHREGIVHGDLKLENILLTENLVKICDFGLSSRAEHESLSKDVKGTLEYLPPEYVQGKDSSFGRDIWAIGIIAHELMLSKNPLQNLTQNEKWSKMLAVQQLKVQDDHLTPHMKEFFCMTLCSVQHRATCSQLLSLPLFSEYSPPEYTLQGATLF